MPDVFILGAGFSRAINASMPMMSDLTAAVHTNDCIDLPPPLKDLGNRKYMEIKENVELWLTYLYPRQPWLHDHFNDLNLSVANRIIKYITELIEAGTFAAVQSPPPPWLITLVKQWHHRRASVITLNYDTLVERIARRLGIELTQLYSSASSRETFEFIKLHGSINWRSFEDDGDSGSGCFMEVAPWTSQNNPNDSEARALTDTDPFIIPPLTEKSIYYENTEIRQLWQRAGDAIDAATRVFVIGYSLPASDMGMQLFLMRSLLDESTPWYLINPDSGALNHFNSLLPRYRFIDSFISTEDPVAKFVGCYPALPTL